MTDADRKKRAEEIIAHPQFFTVCLGCDAIVKRGKVFCPSCGGYHFEEDIEKVCLHAALLGSRPQTQEVIEWE